MSAIEVAELYRSYTVRRGRFRKTAETVRALDGISFRVEPGELFGLLGPNGAGKTTTIRILSTLLLPDSGSAFVLGRDVVSDAKQVRRSIGFMFGGERGLYGRVSGWENLRYFANLYGMPTRQSTPRIGELLEMVGLSERARDKVDTYSRGMRQRLHIARVMLHDPEVLYLDEPTSGLDPVVAHEVRDLVVHLTTMGRTILLTTHYMQEADEICDRVAIINKGRIVALGAPAELRKLVPDLYVLEVELVRSSPDAVRQLEVLGGGGCVLSTRDSNGGQIVRMQSAQAPDLAQRVPEVLSAAQVRTVLLREPTLEDVYIRLVGDDGKSGSAARDDAR
jgi:ABC-2 type transport system ATP-binding protein